MSRTPKQEPDIRADVAARAESAEWGDATPDHLVELHAYLLRNIGEVDVPIIGRERANAVRAARKILAEQFGGDADEAVRFMRWSWEREAERAARGPCDPMGWRRQFSVSLVTDYRVSKARKGESVPDPAEDDRPTIIIATDEARVADDAVAALSRDDRLYQQGNRLVRVVDGAPSKRSKVKRAVAPVVRALTAANVREIISRAARLVRDQEGELVDAHPPEWLPKMVLDRGEWPRLRRLEAIAETPFLRPDGTIAAAAGWDEATEVLLVPGIEPIELPDAPTRDDAVAALDELAAVFADFPFAAGRVHLSAVLASLLGKLARYAYDGPTPATVLDATVAGSGKGLLARAISAIAVGREPPMMAPSSKEDEMRKRLFALVLEGERDVCIDNVVAAIDDPALDSLITAPAVKDRILGVTGMGEAPNHLQVTITGNNVVTGSDFARRILHIRIQPRVEDPEERTDIEHPGDQLVAWIAKERPRLVRACLVALRAYAAEGRPPVTMRPWGSFEAWSDAVRAPLVWAGWPDPALTRAERSTADSPKVHLSNLLREWRAEFGDRGTTAAAAVALLATDGKQTNIIPKHAGLASAIDQFCPAPAGKDASAPRVPSARSLGNRLRTVRGRVIGELEFVEGGSTSAGVIWIASVVRPANDSGDSEGSLLIAERQKWSEGEKGIGVQIDSSQSAESLSRRPLRKRSEAGRAIPSTLETPGAAPRSDAPGREGAP